MKVAKSTVNYSLTSYVDQTTYVILGLMSLLYIIGAAQISINQLFIGYHGYYNIPIRFVYYSPLIIALFIGASSVLRHAPPEKALLRMAFYVRSTSLLLLLGLGLSIFVMGGQYTPFHQHDIDIARLDHLMHFNIIVVMNWVAQHPILHKILRNFYFSLGPESLILAFLSPLFADRRIFNAFVIGIIIASLIGFFIYYFFPTVGPPEIYHSPYFPRDAVTIVKHFVELHHYKIVSNMNGGLISFPSYHVIYCCLIIYPFYRIKWLFYPLVIINLIIVTAALVLGWHYLTDILGGFVISALVIFLTQKIINVCSDVLEA